MENFEKLEVLYGLCGIVMDKLEECKENLSRTKDMSVSDIEIVDKLSHSLKSIKACIAMMEEEEEEVGMSERSYRSNRSVARGRSNRRSRDGGSYEGGSYEGSYEGGNSGRRRRDSMGRYARSRAAEMDELLTELREQMQDMPDEQRREAQRFVQKMESM